MGGMQSRRRGKSGRGTVYVNLEGVTVQEIKGLFEVSSSIRCSSFSLFERKGYEVIHG